MARGVAEHYELKIRSGEITPDPAQRAVVNQLDELARTLEVTNLATKKSALGWLWSRKAPPPSPRGLYIWGSVGRGKTMLMDLFFNLVNVKLKRRAHFLEFMADVHDRVRRARAVLAANDGRDPIEMVAHELAGEIRLICFDEFSVTDIADAMILGRLFTRLFDAGVVMVATSNVDPKNLYQDGLNRALFLPFIALLQERCAVAMLDSPTDYRMEKLAESDIYIMPLGPSASASIEKIWRKLTRNHEIGPVEFEVKARKVKVRQASHGVARFGFLELCGQPLGALDYQALISRFDTFIVEDVPVMPLAMRNEAKRFITFVDTLYDNGIKLVISADATPDDLYRGEIGTEAFEWARCASRLNEMRSLEYRAQPRKPPHVMDETTVEG